MGLACETTLALWTTNGIDTACLANALAYSPLTDSTRKGFEIPRRAPPPCVYLLFTWRNRTWPNLPGAPSPSVFAYCKRSNTGGGSGLGTRLGHIPRSNFLARLGMRDWIWFHVIRDKEQFFQISRSSIMYMHTYTKCMLLHNDIMH